MKIDNNTIRYYLHTFDCLEKDIELERELIEDFRKMQIDSIAKASMGLRVQGGKQENMLEKIAAERLDILTRHEERLTELLTVYGGIQAYRNKLQEGEINWCILQFRYFDKRQGKGNTWEDVKRKLEGRGHFYTSVSIQNRDVEIMKDIIKRCVFRQKK